MIEVENKALASSQQEDFCNARILIADERNDMHDSVLNLLKQVGCKNLTGTVKKEEILQSLREGYLHPSLQPDLLILSTSISGLDAFNLCKQISGSDLGMTPVVLLSEGSGYWNEDGSNTAYRAGAIDLLYRPLRVTDLIPRIRLAILYRNERRLRIDQGEALSTELSERRVIEVRMNHLVNHDELTGLSSRRRLESSINIAIGKSVNLGKTSALLYMDIEDFRSINDTMGHKRGDRLLTRTADLLRALLPNSELVARIGSDEFGVLLENVDIEAALDTAEQLSNAMEAISLGSELGTNNISLNIGIVMIEPGMNSKNASRVLARGDQACHIAEERKDTHIYAYDSSKPEIVALKERRELVHLIRKSLTNDWFSFDLQPIVRLADGTVSHYEVLLRMKDEAGKQYPPSMFIPLAERSGLISRIDFWVVENALNMMERLPPALSNVGLSINVSGNGLQGNTLIELIKTKLSMNWMNPAHLTFEITETEAVADIDKTRETIAHLKALGCRFAIDDFGSGFASFNYIKNFPVDYVKIDGMFIHNLVNDHEDQILVRSMVDIAHNLGKQVVAEFVQNRETIDLLRDFGVDYVQGYFLGKPEPSEVVFRRAVKNS